MNNKNLNVCLLSFSVAAVAADYMCYHYNAAEQDLIQKGILSERLVCEDVASQIYAEGGVNCGVCRCCQGNLVYAHLSLV